MKNDTLMLESKAPHEPTLNRLESLKAWLEKLEPTFKKLELAREPIISIN